jgi:putative membrane protein
MLFTADMLLRLAVRLVLLALIIGLVAELVPGINFDGSFWNLLWIAVLFSLINLIIGPILRLLSLPLIILTLGLFLLVVNAAILGITAAWSSHLSIDGFWDAVLGGLIIAVCSWLSELILPLRDRQAAHRY